MLAAGLVSPAAARTVVQRASPSETLGAHPTVAMAADRHTVAADIPLAAHEERAKCSVRLVPAVVRRPRCRSNPAATSRSTARPASSSAAAMPTTAQVAIATAAAAAEGATSKHFSPGGTLPGGFDVPKGSPSWVGQCLPTAAARLLCDCRRHEEISSMRSRAAAARRSAALASGRGDPAWGPLACASVLLARDVGGGFGPPRQAQFLEQAAHVRLDRVFT